MGLGILSFRSASVWERWLESEYSPVYRDKRLRLYIPAEADQRA